MTELGLADAEAVADLRFDALWAVLAGQRDAKAWSTSLDFYNLLVIELVRQVQCEGALFDIAVAVVPHEKVYLDPLIVLDGILGDAARTRVLGSSFGVEEQRLQVALPRHRLRPVVVGLEELVQLALQW